MIREGKIQFQHYVTHFQITTTYSTEEILFYLFPVHPFASCIFKNSTLHMLTPNLGTLKEAKKQKHDFLLCNPLDQPISRFSKVCKRKCSTRGLCYK